MWVEWIFTDFRGGTLWYRDENRHQIVFSGSCTCFSSALLYQWFSTYYKDSRKSLIRFSFNAKLLEEAAYKEQHSCETALLRVQADVLKSVDNKQCAVLLLLDLSIAFDTVDHEILLHRLRSKFGIKVKAYAWLQSYLTDRSQSVQLVKLMGLFLQFTRSDLVYLRVPCWARCCISYTRPHWVT